MAENKPCCGNEKMPGKIREAVCIDTNRVYDSCADKDCLADLRVYFTPHYQGIIDCATSVRCRGCEILNVFIEVEKIPFNRGCYAVDITFFFKVTLDAFSAPTTMPIPVCGFTTFSKKCILYGSEGNVKVYSSEYKADGDDQHLIPTNTNPKAKIQVADPICLDAKICRPCDCCDNLYSSCVAVPKCIRCAFDDEFDEDLCKHCDRAVAVTIGIFTIVQLERDVQMLIPAYDFCIPTKECACDADDPCEAFRKIRFPVDEFFPPNEDNSCECGSNKPILPPSGCGCGC
ncbi:MAG: hypothetical protein RR552_03600 [Oscillospiraceae bacterium]